MIAFVDKMRDRFGVGLLCRVMRQAEVGFLTAGGHRAAKARPASARQERDELLVPEIRRLHAENYGVYGSGRCMRYRTGKAGSSAATIPVGSCGLPVFAG